MRKAFIAAVAAATAAAALVVGPSPAGAATVKYTKTTATLNLGGSATLEITPGGQLLVWEDGPPHQYDGRANLVINHDGADLTLRFSGGLAGSLTLNLNSTTATTVHLIGNGLGDQAARDLTIVGSNADQLLRVEGPTYIPGNVQIDTRGGSDRLDVPESLLVDKNVKLKNVERVHVTNDFWVTGTFTADTKTSTAASQWSVHAGHLYVGKNFTLTGSAVDDVWEVVAPGKLTVHGNFTVNHAAGRTSQRITLSTNTTTISGNVKYIAGKNLIAGFYLGPDNSVAKNVTVKLEATTTNDARFYGSVGGTKISYTGSNAFDLVQFNSAAPRAKVNVATKGANDQLYIVAAATLRQLTANLGAGTDTFDSQIDLPPKSKVTGVP